MSVQVGSLLLLTGVGRAFYTSYKALAVLILLIPLLSYAQRFSNGLRYTSPLFDDRFSNPDRLCAQVPH